MSNTTGSRSSARAIAASCVVVTRPVRRALNHLRDRLDAEATLDA